MTADDDADRAPGHGRWPPSRVALVAVIVLGVALRAVRLFAEGYPGDEPFEIFVRRAVLDHGWPLLPSGQVSSYGGILLWPGALGTWIGGMSVFWNRLPMFLLGCGAICVVGRTASRRLGPWAGVAAAAIVAFHPGHIEWTANVKIYGAMTLFTACAADAWFAWTLDDAGEDTREDTREDDRRAPRRFALFATLAALVHPAAAFTVAGFAVAGLCMRGPRWAFAPRTLLAFAAPGAALVAFALVMRFADPAMTEHLVASGGGGEGGGGGARRLLKHLWAAAGSHGWHSTWHAVPFALAAIGSAIAAVRLWTGHGREGGSLERTTLAASLAWGAAFTAFTTVSMHQGAMYLLPTFPLLAIGAAGGLRLLCGTGAGAPLRAAVLGASALGAHIAVSWSVWPGTFDPSEGVARVWRHVTAASKPGEISLGGGPHAVLYSGGKLNDFMIYGGDLGASSFLRDGRRYDRYLGNPVLGTVDQIRPVVEAAPRTWYFIADKEIDAGRVTPEVHAWLTARMALVDETPGFRLYATPPR